MMRDTYWASSDSRFVSTLGFRRTQAAAHIRAAMRFGALLVLFGVTYFLTARISRGEFFARSRIGLLWVPNALLLSAFVLTSRRRWWLILGAASIAHVLALGPANQAWRMAWQLPVQAGFVIALMEMLRRFAGFPLRFQSPRQVLAYIGVTFVMLVPLALTAPGFVLSLAGIEPFFAPGTEFERLMLANLTPMLLVAPAVLLVAGGGADWIARASKQGLIEAAVIMGAMLVTSLFVFFSAPTIARYPWLIVLAFPPLVWAAMRLGPVGASVSLLCVGTCSIAGAALQRGPFVVNASDDVVFSIQIYWIAISVPILLLAAAISEREERARLLQERQTERARVTQAGMMAELSGALSNELSQPLTAILANAPAAKLLLARQPISAVELHATLSDIEREARQAAALLGQFRGRARQRTPHFESIDVGSVLRDALSLSSCVLDATRVEVLTEIARDLPRVRADRVQLVQVLLDVIANSCDALDGRADGKRKLRLRVAQPDPQHVELTVADSGSGLPNGDGEQLFELFFTTKTGAMGMGLPVARSIVCRHGGRLWAEPNEHGGATFHLLLPLQGSCRATSGDSR